MGIKPVHVIQNDIFRNWRWRRHDHKHSQRLPSVSTAILRPVNEKTQRRTSRADANPSHTQLVSYTSYIHAELLNHSLNTSPPPHSTEESILLRNCSVAIYKAQTQVGILQEYASMFKEQSKELKTSKSWTHSSP